ncbi:Hormone receptor domain [Popillia japonica]|uniref:Hormone receptor domain n=1 Tax=Popillia japonica TaxID=7064 RepID=A0AAW1MC99_POPJA
MEHRLPHNLNKLFHFVQDWQWMVTLKGSRTGTILTLAMDGYIERIEDGYDTHVEKILAQINDSHIVCEIKKKFSRPSNGCDVAFDSVLCWPRPQTPPNTLAVLPCFSQLNGIHYDTRNNASRFCFPNGTWDQYTDYTNCTELMLEGIDVELTTTIYFVGYAISLVGLIIAVYIFWRFK